MKRSIALMVGDGLCAVTAILAAHLFRLGEMPGVESFTGQGGVRLALFVIVMLFCAFFVEVYHQERELTPLDLIGRISIELVLAFFVLSALYFFLPIVMDGRGVLMIATVVFGLFQFLWHAGSRGGFIFPSFAKRVLILGTGPLANQMGSLVTASGARYVLSGYVACSREPVYVPAQSIVGSEDGLYETVRRARAHKIVVSLGERRGVFPLKDVLNCKLSGVEVVDAPSFYERVTGKLLIESINPSWFIFSSGFRVTALNRLLKRGIDIFCALLGGAFFLPFLPIVALAIRFDSPGPVLFRQERVGEREKPFYLFKFRTMRTDAEKGTGAVWAQKDDPRVTRLGRFLRKSRIDEIPQLFNVLMGDMSLVGPRPERPEFVEQLKKVIPYYSERHFVKPGVTGWAQVRYPYGASVEDAVEKLRYDLYYIKNLSVAFDIMIIFETVKVVLFQRGGR
ncbi:MULTISPECIES: TIGR03013 family XrtA/PEP-CTERM system glycosyltransferase [Geobacter]|uniref:TIGR03013 family XrtA/PEP-CTERM system glycosyltransferase n=1 Tax=Geobacter TaxID=28231 RepID=UPI002573E143|nr:TIGR03013 family XrtA/PEP-CTERM system glycosyltransferase [Geobacter sulfurreducens]BEH10018.1 TIGR03013 family PEP-CTERM/XrtA system glycosyltransferase [Geobacter sulfurreducens subsp. ethanolicus]BET58393.1 TIGR03013 family PEP-CTERM/XrtA system glycosyltransferase [Geobacter sp. 60473]HML77991.1 TIGR03013 family PEP-CTERM/XrtA system glycosyltransferase [Geobacter sulfurreducens]